MTWGLGNVGTASIATLAKDLRRRLMGRDRSSAGWKLTAKFTVESVANRFVEVVYPLYAAEFSGVAEPPFLGLLVTGYSADDGSAEAWQIGFNSATVAPVPTHAIKKDDSGWAAYAQTDAVNRLFNGFGEELHNPIVPPSATDRADPADSN